MLLFWCFSVLCHTEKDPSKAEFHYLHSTQICGKGKDLLTGEYLVALLVFYILGASGMTLQL